MCTQVISQQKIKKNYTSKFFSFIASVLDTGDKHSFAKFSCQTPLNVKSEEPLQNSKTSLELI
jgi:hypothetical protein